MVLRLLLAAVCLASAEGADKQFDALPKRLAFVSCAKQRKHKYLEIGWSNLEAKKPDTLYWTGDAVYPDNHRIGKLVELSSTYSEQKANKHYQQLIASIPISVDGTIDDHDFGLNDGDKSWHWRDEAKNMFLDFIDEPEQSVRRGRDGTYVSHVYGAAPQQIKVIMLDTRYNRDVPFTYNLQQKYGYLAPIVSISTRFLRQVLGFGRNFGGDMLGERQWKWLEDELKHSEASVHIIVSSVQVMTTFGVIESWGQYPIAKQRLFNLMQSTKPRGLLFVSGDVHFGQILGSEDGVVEMTSSGITHSVGDIWPLWQALALGFLPKRVYGGKNFSYVDIDFQTTADGVLATSLKTTICDIHGKPQLTTKQLFRSDEDVSARLKQLDDLQPTIPHRSGRFQICVILLLILGFGWACQFAGILSAYVVQLCSRRSTATKASSSVVEMTQEKVSLLQSGGSSPTQQQNTAGPSVLLSHDTSGVESSTTRRNNSTPQRTVK